MKKILTILFLAIFLIGYSQESKKLKTLKITGKIVNEAGDTLIAPFSGIGNYYKNVRNPIDSLDAINKRYLEAYIDTATLSPPLDSLLFSTDINSLGWKNGMLYYDSTRNNLVFYDANSEVGLDIGKEQWIDAWNMTASTITNGQVVYVDTVNNMTSTIELARADLPTTSRGVIGIATHDIEVGTIGRVTTFGIVRDLNTSGLSAGEIAYVSATSDGGIVDSRPEYPNYAIQIGQVLVADNDSGEIFVNKIGRIEDILDNAWNGAFIESFNFGVISNGTTITGYLESAGGDDYLTMNFSDGFTLLDVSPADSIILTAGTDASPQIQYVYILKSTKQLTVSTSFWPSTEHIPVAIIALRSSSTTQTDGALRNQNINDHVAGLNGQGHISHIGRRMRKMNAAWESGTEGSVTIVGASTPDDVYAAVTGGKIWQLHLQDFPAFDMQTGSDAHIVNDFTSPYKTVMNLNGETLDANGVTLANSSFSFVLWGVANRTGQMSHMMINLPTGNYAKNDPDLAVSDASNYSVYDIPQIFQGNGFLIARFTFTLDAAGEVWTLYDTEDLRGKVPNNVAGGGGAGGGGSTTFLGLTDTPSSYSGEAGNIPRVGGGETALEFSTPAAAIINGGDSIVLQNEVYDFTTTLVNDSLDNYWSRQEITEADTAFWNSGAGGFADPMTTRGDIIIRNTSNVTDRLGIGANTYVLTSDGTDPSWQPSTGAPSIDTIIINSDIDTLLAATPKVITFSTPFDDSDYSIIGRMGYDTLGRSVTINITNKTATTFTVVSNAFDCYYEWVATTNGTASVIGSGEANTASNVGTAGVGLFKQKTGIDLEFKKINGGSNKVTITDDTGNSEVDIDVVEANLAIAASQITDLQDSVSVNTDVVANTAKITNATHSGEVTGFGGSPTLVITDNVVDEANLKLDTSPTNDFVLTADNTTSGGFKWAANPAGFSDPMTTRGD